MPNLKKIYSKIFSFWPLLSILVITLVFFWKVIIRGLVPIPADFIVGVYYPWLDYKWGYSTGVPVKNPITTDVVSLIYPEQMLAIDLMKSGQWPLWNPTILAGTPLLANLQAAPFSPTNLVYVFLDKVSGWSVQIILQHIIAAVSLYLLLRHFKISKVGSLLGGIVYSFSGFNLIFSQWNGHTLASAFIPLVLLFQDKWFGGGKFLYGFLLSIILALQLFSGYPQTCLYTAVAMIVFWVFSFKWDKVFLTRTLVFALFLLLALGLSAIQLLPSAQLWGLSQRNYEPHPFEWAFLPVKKIITTIAADYFGNHATHNYWGPQDYTSNGMYVGVVAFCLSIISFGRVKRDRNVVMFFALVVISLLLSFATPISTFLWSNNIFGMRAASAHRAIILFDLGLSALAGYGMDQLIFQAKSKYRVVAFLTSAFAILAFFVYAYLIRGKEIHGMSVFTVGSRNLVLPAMITVAMGVIFLIKNRLRSSVIAGTLIMFFSVFELFYFGWKYTPFSSQDIIYPTTPVLDFFKTKDPPFRVTGNKVIPVNIRTPYGLESLEGYETIHPLVMSQFLSAVNNQRSGTLPTGRYGIVDNDTAKLLDLANTKYYLALKESSGDRFKNERFVQVFEDKSVAVFESKSALPRAFVVYDWEVENDGMKIIDNLLDSNFSFSSKVYLEENPTNLPTGSVSSDKSIVTYQKYTANESVIKINSSHSGMLFVSDAYYPGWKAYVDNQEAKIFRADFAFRAVEVSSGEHLVRFVYRPDSFRHGLIISGISLGLLIFLVFVVRGRSLEYTLA